MSTLNESIFFFFHNFAGTSLAFDTLIIFSAKFLVWWIITGLILATALFSIMKSLEVKRE